MAKRKSKYDDFITMCEKNRKLYALATTSTPSCNRYDVIDGNFVIPEKSASHKSRHPGVLQNLMLYLLHTASVDIPQKNRKRS